MCLAVALRNVASITDIGEMPFDSARPILKHIENPAQLHELEVNCPQLTAEPEQMAEIWSRLLYKKFPKWDEKGYAIDDDMSWYDTFVAVKDAVDRDNAEATAQLQRQLAGFDRDKEGHATLLVNNRALLRKMPGATAKRRTPGGQHIGAFSFGAGSRTKMTTGQSVMRRARREAREIGKISALSTPTGALRVAQGQIRKAPEAMVHDHRVARNPEVVIRAPKKRSSASSGPLLPPGDADAEARLLALKAGQAAVPAVKPGVRPAGKPVVRATKPVVRPVVRPLTSKRPLDADDAFDDDDLFGDSPKKKPCLTVDDLEQPTSARPRAASPVRPTARTDRRSPGPSAPTPARRKVAVDIFMRPKKR